MEKIYWKSLGEKRKIASKIKKNLGSDTVGPADIDFSVKHLKLSRRTFLKALGATFAMAFTTACARAPIRKAVPYLIKPEGVVPGKSTYFASTCKSCSAQCGVVVKSHDGRPIKIEGNPDHVQSLGGLCAVGQASIFNLYDSNRLKEPMALGKKVSLDELDVQVKAALEKVKQNNKPVYIVTSTESSPSLKTALNQFSNVYGAKVVIYDAISADAILDAHASTHGMRVLPQYHYDRANVIVSFGADFLGAWISPVSNTKKYVQNRKLDNKRTMSKHYQIESLLTLTGSNADERYAVAPKAQKEVLMALIKAVGNKLGVDTGIGAVGAGLDLHIRAEKIEKIATDLVAARGSSLVLSGDNDFSTQVAVNYLNNLLGNYGNTLDLNHYSLQKQGSHAALEDVLTQLKSNSVGAIIFLNANPVYNHSDDWAKAIGKANVSISISDRLDETAIYCQYNAPLSHALESWGDAQPTVGVYSMVQPLIRPIFKSRSAIEHLIAFTGQKMDVYEYVKNVWQTQIYSRQARYATFDGFWKNSLKVGVLNLGTPSGAPGFNAGNVNASINKLKAALKINNDLELVLYPKVAIREGAHANNAWLHELPDPITKATWGNYVSVSQKTARKLKLKQDKVVKLTAGDVTIELPVLIQPGQSENTLGVAYGYGRKYIGKIGNNLGANVFPFLNTDLNNLKIRRTSRTRKIAQTQTHHSMEGRAIVKETVLSAYLKNPKAGNEEVYNLASMYKPHTYKTYRWAMAIDLNSCTGCSACVVACQVENNIPTVGKTEVARRREMHWLRLDRYYSEDHEGNVQTVHQPMMCQHCESASCENVCPVLATLHSDDGLNQQVYNRCVGTRYCANNCPYKVRRFNWFNYPHKDMVLNLALNPEVTVRTRGIMEKCSMCVQRIETKKIEVRIENRRINDGEIKTACQESCPADAIMFGDINDPKSRISRVRQNPRRYQVLEEVKNLPVVSYLTKVRNLPESPNAKKKYEKEHVQEPAKHG